MSIGSKEFGEIEGKDEILSTIKPKKSRNGRPEITSLVSSSDMEISALLSQDKENQNFDIYNQMLHFHSKKNSEFSETEKDSYNKCKNETKQKLTELQSEHADLCALYKLLTEENQKLTSQLGDAEDFIDNLQEERNKYTHFSRQNNEENLISQLNLRAEEMKQAKEYIQELENVVEKSKDNIVFLKDLVLNKDEKYKKVCKEIQFYKELSETHIVESTRLAKDLIHIRSRYSKVTAKKSQEMSIARSSEKTYKSYEMPKSRSISNFSKPKIKIEFSRTNTESSLGIPCLKTAMTPSSLSEYQSLILPASTPKSKDINGNITFMQSEPKPSRQKRRLQYHSLISKLNC
mmetsp:Transcript_10145/g.8941  ORF Transcript_10145/g.8941 Transcript_10145/m.8941 type:complete len:348 (-) Transcript_10145:20-1063(-)